MQKSVYSKAIFLFFSLITLSVNGMELAWLCTHAIQLRQKFLDATQPQEQFEKAVRKQDIERIQYLLETKKIDIKQRVPLKSSDIFGLRLPSLWYAFMDFNFSPINNFDMAHLLLQHGAQIDAVSSMFCSFLYFEKLLHVINLENESPESIKSLHFLIAHDASSVVLGRHGELPLHLAAYRGNMQMAQALLNAPWYQLQNQKRLTTFLCCLRKLKEQKKLPPVPKDIQKLLCHYIMAVYMLPHITTSLNTQTSKRIWVHQAAMTIPVNLTPLQIAREQQKKYPDDEKYKKVAILLEKASRWVNNYKQGTTCHALIT